ncbi:MAG: hypothetical protein ACLQQ4_01985 [Bacteroidia bacterium]|jgi:hypothetical protein
MTAYEQLAPNSKVWVFQAEREFSAPGLNILNERLTAFVNNWLSHGSLLNAHFKVLHNRFILFFADAQGEAMCGRAVDSSVRFVKELEAELGISMLNRNLVAYMKDGKVFSCTLNELARLSEEGKIGPDTIMFNNLVATKADFEKNWMLPLSLSWHHNYILQNQ